MDTQSKRPMLRVVMSPMPVAAVPATDPIYAVIEAHQNAYRDHIEGVEAENDWEEGCINRWNMDAEQAMAFARLGQVTGAAFDRMKGLSVAMVTTKPTTIAGIGAVCRYLKSVLEEDTPGLPLECEFGNLETGMGIFCDTIAAAIEGGVNG